MVNQWDEVLGPFYAESGLHKHGIEDVIGLIALHYSDGTVVYPHAQFDVLPDETLHRREEVIDLWNTMIQPAIDEGVIDEWSATGLLLQGTEDEPSEAEKIARDKTHTETVGAQIAGAINRYRH